MKTVLIHLIFVIYCISTSAQSPWEGYLVTDGMGDYAEAEDQAELDIGDNEGENLTVEAWVNFTEFSDAHIVVKKNAYILYSIDDGNFRGLGFLLNPIGMVASTSVDFAGGGFWEPGWHHVAGVFDQNKGELSVYLDGEKLHSWESGEHEIANSPEPLQVGVNVNGEIDEVRISNAIRYDSSFTVPAEPFVHDDATRGLWHFNEGTGSVTCSDASGHDNVLVCIGDAQINSITAQKSFSPEASFYLKQNVPNPFISETSILFKVHKRGNLKLDILDLSGKTIETIFEGYIPPGEYTHVWTPGGQSPGVYICKLKFNQISQTRKMVLSK
jgi:hypothetical protein